MTDLIDSLVGYVNDIKPYHTKIFGVGVEYVTSDDINITITEDLRITLDLGLPTCEFITSLAIAVGDDDGWDAKPFDSLPWDIIQTDEDGICVPEDRYINYPQMGGWDTLPLDSSEYDPIQFLKSTGFHDYAITYVSENLEIEGQTILSEMEIESTLDNDARSSICETLVITDGDGWDSTTDGIRIAEYGTNYVKIGNDLVDMFNSIVNFDIVNSSNNNGTYTVDVATYDPIERITTIYLIENTLNDQITDGSLHVGFYDALPWDNASLIITDSSDDVCRTSPPIGIVVFSAENIPPPPP